MVKKLLILALYLLSTPLIYGQTPTLTQSEQFLRGAAQGAAPGGLGAAVFDSSRRGVCNFAGTKADVCFACMADADKAWTAIGCVDTDPSAFITIILTFGIGIAGGIAFLLILIGGLQMMTSAGNPEKLNAGRELIGSSIAGLLLVIFSVFILRLIGVDILGLPGFT